MGEIAEDMIDGTACELCGQYFIDKDDTLYTHGYPVVCWSCWDDLDKKEKRVHTKADVQTL